MTALPLSPAELAEVQARADKATPGPWHGGVDDDSASGTVMLWGSHPEYPELAAKTIAEFWGDSAQPEIDAEFIAHAREDIPRLLATIYVNKISMILLNFMG